MASAERKYLWERQKAWNRQAASHPKMTLTKARVVMVLQNYFNLETGEARPGADRLAEESGVKRRNVQAVMKDLAADGLITIIPGTGRGNPNRYVRVDKVEEKSIPTDALSDDENSIPADALCENAKGHTSATIKGIPTDARNKKGMRKVGGGPPAGPLPRSSADFESHDLTSSIDDGALHPTRSLSDINEHDIADPDHNGFYPLIDEPSAGLEPARLFDPNAEIPSETRAAFETLLSRRKWNGDYNECLHQYAWTIENISPQILLVAVDMEEYSGVISLPAFLAIFRNGDDDESNVRVSRVA